MKKFSQSVKDRILNYPENLKRAKIRFLKNLHSKNRALIKIIETLLLQ